MLESLKQNITPISLVLLAVALLGGAVYLQGCSLADVIPVEVPRKVATATGLPPSVPLSQAGEAFDDWALHVERETERFTKNIDEANQKFGFITALVNTSLTAAEPIGSAFPGGALVVALLTGAAGLLIEKPGTSKRLKDHTDAAYDEGLAQGKKIADEAVKLIALAKGQA